MDPLKQGEGGGQVDTPEGLDALEAAAAGLEGQAQQAQQEKQAEQQASQVRTVESELLKALMLVRTMASPAFAWWTEFARCWSDQQLTAVASAGAAVMVAHGWTMGDLFSKWGPHIALISAVVPPSLVTYQAIRLRRESVTTVEMPGPAP